MPESKESKIERIAKNIVGMSTRTQRVHCRISDVRPLIESYINTIVNNVEQINLVQGKQYPLLRQYDYVLENVHIYFYTDVPNVENTGIVPDDFDESKIVINPDDNRPEYLRDIANISLKITVDYSLQENNGLEINNDNLIAVNDAYDGIVSIVVNPFFNLRGESFSAKNADSLGGVKFVANQPNSYHYMFKHTVAAGFIDTLNDLIHEVFRKYLIHHVTRHLPTSQKPRH